VFDSLCCGEAGILVLDAIVEGMLSGSAMAHKDQLLPWRSGSHPTEKVL